jgi:Flp pilus assembly protein TadG
MDRRSTNNSQLGVATIEFALTASFFFLMIIGVVAGGHLFWTHNALVEATRRGARYAANQCTPTDATCPNYSTTVDRVKNVALYDSSTAGTTPFVPNLQKSNVTVLFSNDFGVAAGNVSVKIENYQYNFFGINRVMPPYQTSVAGENAGFVPPNQ